MSQGEGSRRMNPPPDVIFAQKATAIVKAAGMDPRSIDLEKFRQNASLVFSRAYSAIYKEKLLTVLNENSTKEDKILNSQLVLDGLFTKTRNPILLQLSGQDLYDGNHRAIGVLVGILFAEGQRLWLEKIKGVESHMEGPVLEESAAVDHDMQMRAASELLDRNEDVGSLQDEDLDDAAGFGGDEIRQSLRTLHKLRSNPDIGPVDLERLLSRIAFLEEQLKRKPRKKSKKASKNNLVKRISEAILQDNEINEHGKRGDDDSSDEGNMRTTHSTPRDRREVYKRSESSRSPQRRGHSAGIADRPKKTRPLSAPSTSNRKMAKVRHPSNRLYNTALSRKNTEATMKSPSPSRKGRQKDHEPSEPENNNKVEYYDPNLYTYDWRSGRRILISQAQVEYEERKRAKEAMNNIMAISDNDVDALMGGGGGGAGSPTKANYPSKSISGDVDKWLQRMRRDRYGERKPPPKPEEVAMPEPRYFAAYQKLEDRDLMITIEHCYNCAHHNVTTRHKQDEYVNNSSNFLRVLAHIAHECGVCARVGVSRFKANITPNCATTDENSRIGAFEIQVAYKQPNGKVIPVTLHSKLSSRRWPSKSVLEKRFRSFIASAKISTAGGDDDQPASVHMANDSAEPYPVGSCSWALSPVADPGWSFSTTEAKAAEAVAAAASSASNAPTAGTAATLSSASATSATKSPANTVGPAAAGPSAAISNVQWAFDMRDLADAPPKFAVGSTIRVSKINYSTGNVERHALLCVVKEYEDPDDPHSSDIIVKPKYHVQEIKVPQHNCCNLSNYTDRETDYSPDVVPAELEALLLLGKQHKLISWDLSKGDGKKQPNGDICLSRKGFYQQTRKLAWALEKLLVGRGKRGLLTHPDSGVEVDCQLCYSEEMLDWVTVLYNGEANVTALEKLIFNKGKSPSKSSLSTAWGDSVDPTPRTERSTGEIAPGIVSVAASVTASVNAGVETGVESGVEATVSALTADTPSVQREGGGDSSFVLGQEPKGTDRSSSFPQETVQQSKQVGPDLPSQVEKITANSEMLQDKPSKNEEVNQEEKNQEEQIERSTQSAPIKRFSKIDLVGAADKALKNKIINSLVPQEGNGEKDLTAMERIALLYQVTDAIFEEAILESDEKAELSQASFVTVLTSYGLGEVISHPSVLEALLLKGWASSNAPTQPVKVEPFVNWLLSGESRKHKEAPALSSSKGSVICSSKVNPVESTGEVSVDTAVESPAIIPATEGTVDSSSSGASDHALPSVEKVEDGSQVKTASPKSDTVEVSNSSQHVEEASATSSAEHEPVNEGLAAPASTPPPADPEKVASNSATPRTGRSQPNVAESSSAGETGGLSARESTGSVRASPSAVPIARADSITMQTSRSVKSSEDLEELAKKEEERRKSLVYAPKEMEISTIVIEGDQLVHTFYDTVMVNVKIGVQEWNATTCMAREKGSKRRTYSVKWPEILISADSFRSDHAIVTVAVSDASVTSANSSVPSLLTTTFGDAPHSIRIPMYHFMMSSFDVKGEMHVEPVVISKPGTPASSGAIRVILHGNARDPKGLRTARIMSMRPQDLLNIKFDPLPLDDAEDLLESDEDSVDSGAKLRSNKHSKSGTSGDKDQEELARTLFPKASMSNMGGALKPVTPRMNTLVE